MVTKSYLIRVRQIAGRALFVSLFFLMQPTVVQAHYAVMPGPPPHPARYFMNVPSLWLFLAGITFSASLFLTGKYMLAPYTWMIVRKKSVVVASVSFLTMGVGIVLKNKEYLLLDSRPINKFGAEIGFNPSGAFFTMLLIDLILQPIVLIPALSRMHPRWQRIVAGIWLPACSFPMVFFSMSIIAGHSMDTSDLTLLPISLRIMVQYLILLEAFGPVSSGVIPKTIPHDLFAILISNILPFIACFFCFCGLPY